MRKGILASWLMATCVSLMSFQNIYAEEKVDAVSWLQDSYVGVGAIDMQKMPERKIYRELMAFFLTDQSARQAFDVLEKAGLSEKMLRRIVVGIPSDVEKGEFMVLWDASTPLDQYKPILDKFASDLTSHQYANRNYYCTKNKNVCLTVFSEVVALGSENKLKGIIDVHDAKTAIVKNAPLVDMEKKADQSHDSWLAFWLGPDQRSRLGQGDPLIDLTKDGKGKLMLGAIQAGTLLTDFSAGMRVVIQLQMDTNAAASSFSDIINEVRRRGLQDEDVKTMDLQGLIEGISISSDKNSVSFAINYDEKTFEKLIALVTDLAKSAAHEAEL